MKSTAFKSITAVLGIVGAGASIILGFAMPTFSYNPITEDFTTSTFNFGLMFSCLVGVAILCLIFAGITSILAYLEELGAGQETTDEEVITPIKVERAPEPIEKGDWICPKCGKRHKKYVGSCGCGYSKNQNDLWECPKCNVLTPYNQDNECMNCHWKA
ncbi:MAG: hypothetical protein J1E85_08120 [Ruminococcus sp.]|nr:hypothetical protein [Ruminococcus sp.]